MATTDGPRRTLYFACYDVSCPKRLYRVHHYLLGFRVGGQKSFFECWFTPVELRQTRRELATLTETVAVANVTTNPRRLARVYRRMCGHATPLEYSVFQLVGTERARQHYLADVAAIIDREEDDARCYPLAGHGFQARIGRASLPEGINWTGLPASVA